MNVEQSPKVKKYMDALDVQIQARIKNALRKLASEPPQGDIVSLSGRDGFRLRVGKYRLLFDIIGDRIIVYDIDLRGQVYKHGR
jgi:mRNA interferase RelE/StbE